MKNQKMLLMIAGLVLALLTQNAVPVNAQLEGQENRSSQFTQMAAGHQFTCGLTSDGGVKCWGKNSDGQLGDGTLTYRTSPDYVVGLTAGVIDIDAGEKHACAVLSDGGVKCWGNNDYGQLGIGNKTKKLTPVSVIGLGGGVQAIETGGSHTCALTVADGVKCWGSNFFGELGIGSSDDKTLPVDVNGLTSGVAMLTAKGSSSCVVTTAGGAKCWGDNTGRGTTSASKDWVPVDVTGLTTNISTISAGPHHTCAVTDSGGVKCWGNNFVGALGDGTVVNRWSPVDVQNLGQGVASVSPGDYFTCAVTTSGGAKCWGLNDFGQLGSSSTVLYSVTPADVTGLTSGVTHLDAGDGHVCAMTTGNIAKLWGDNTNGQLGQGGLLLSAVSLFEPIFSEPVIKVDTSSDHICALTSSGLVGCWGSNKFKKLADSHFKAIAEPVIITELGSGVLDISVASYHSCAVTAAGAVKCWGDNIYGQLGDGNRPNSSTTPVQVTGLESGYVSVVSGSMSTCALSSGGGVKCWGTNFTGQLGNGTFDSSDTPVDVVGLSSGVAALTDNAGTVCALLDTGGVKCWGHNQNGQLGDGNAPTHSNVPVQVVGLESGVAVVDAGVNHVCALMDDGSQKCWGSNLNGAVGDNTTQDRHTPVAVTVFNETVQAISAGYSFTCVLTMTNAVKCWGRNLDAELGNGTLYTSLTPVNVIALEGNVTQLDAGSSASCVILVGGRVKCWGENKVNQLGSPQVVHTNTPLDLGEDYGPRMSLNYDSAASGGYVALTGHFYDAAETLSLYADETLLGAFTTTQTGNFVIFLEITGAGEGAVSLEVRSSSETLTATTLTVADTHIAHPKEGDGQTFTLYMNTDCEIFLPLTIK